MNKPTVAARPQAPVTAEFKPLHVYLKGRYADNVVLTFTQIEDLLGHALPAPARSDEDWWANADASGEPSAQARSWVQADRTATPHLSARTVSFVRGQSR
jgi:hypothetical protein